MKTKKLGKKLVFKRETISNLGGGMKNVLAGCPGCTCHATECNNATCNPDNCFSNVEGCASFYRDNTVCVDW